MCMLFLYVNPNPGPEGYMLVLASVRDEFYDRPTRQCQFWDNNSSIIGGMDLEEEKAGGTWLAMNTSGKIASLLNIMQPLHDNVEGQKSRGFLGVHYLESNYDGPTYLRSLMRDSHEYHAYLLVTLDVSPSLRQVNVAAYNNTSQEPPAVLRSGVHVFGNCSPRRPWKKVQAAKQQFSAVVNRHRNIRKKEAMIHQIFAMLRDDTEHFPDAQLQRDAEGYSEECVQRLSAIFIKIPETLFGTRTHSVILVDPRGHVDFIEKTMKEPISVQTSNQWLETRYAFNIQDQNAIVSRL